jgi:hypothetical protein
MLHLHGGIGILGALIAKNAAGRKSGVQGLWTPVDAGPTCRTHLEPL